MADETVSPAAEAVGRPEAAAAAAEQEESRLRLYDFRQPSRISKDRLRSLEAMYGLLSKSLEGWLTGRLRSPIELGLQGVEQLRFGEFVSGLDAPCTSYVYDIADSGGQQAIIDFGRGFSFLLVDRLLGGTGAPILLDRALTPLERMILRVVSDRVAADLADVWRDHVPMALSLNRFESIPDMLQIANREDPVLVAKMGMRASETDSELHLCLPFRVLEKFFTGSGPQRVEAVKGTDEERAQDRQGIESAIHASRVTVTARLPAFELPLQAISRLRPGQVLATGLPTGTEAALLVNGQARFRARPGRAGRAIALRIVDPVSAQNRADEGPHQRGRTH